MATPSSSVTSASPPMSYLQVQPNSQTTTTSATMILNPTEKEQRKKAVQKFIARAEISMVTRALRARLSYASYKATHNISHVPLRDLEAQSQAQTAVILSRTQVAKRKSTALTNNYYNNPNTQGNGTNSSNSSKSSLSGTRRGNMAPPVAPNSSSTLRQFPNANPNDNNRNTNNVTQSLYTSLLAPPPAKQARTIHNASDPPLAPPKRPSAAPSRSRRASEGRSARSIAESTRAQAKNKKGDPKSRAAGKDKKGKQKDRSVSHPVVGSREDADVDMKAAATLTSLLFHSRPGASPRPSTAGSVGASLPPSQPYAHGSTRVSMSAPTSADSSFNMTQPTPHSAPSTTSTPPPLSSAPRLDHSATLTEVGSATNSPGSGLLGRPHERTNDTEAADLMLFLATSPSPARPMTAKDRDAKDSAAFRALGGGSGGLRAKGRVLFPTSDVLLGENVGRPLVRNNDSFNTSMSSVGSQLGSGVIMANTRPASPALTPAQLLLAPASPQPRSQNQDSVHSMSSPTPWSSSLQAPPTPGNLPFNFNDFINVSPSPAAAPARNPGSVPMKSSLRADVGRKLFEEEQQRHFKDPSMSGMVIGKTSSFGEELGAGDRSGRGGTMGLGAGIDLVQT